LNIVLVNSSGGAIPSLANDRCTDNFIET